VVKHSGNAGRGGGFLGKSAYLQEGEGVFVFFARDVLEEIFGFWEDGEFEVSWCGRRLELTTKNTINTKTRRERRPRRSLFLARILSGKEKDSGSLQAFEVWWGPWVGLLNGIMG
jgi:hypothetical protein